MAVLFCTGSAAANGGYWIKSSGASWANAANWDPADGIAGGINNTAYFGLGRESFIAPNSSFTLDGARTIGNLCFATQSGAGNWSLNTGSGGSLTLADTFQPPAITVTAPMLRVTLNAVLAGGAGLEKDGAGTLVLAANNTYSGQTLVSGGGLIVNGTVGTGGVEVAKNATLSGTGVIMGPVAVGSGGVLAAGTPFGSLTISNSLGQPIAAARVPPAPALTRLAADLGILRVEQWIPRTQLRPRALSTSSGQMEQPRR